MAQDQWRILHIVNELGLGGTEKTAQLLAESLPKSKYRCTVVTLRNGGFRENSLRKHHIQVVNTNQDPALLSALLKKKKFNLVHIHNVYVSLELFTNEELVLHHQFSQPIYSMTEYKRFKLCIFNSQRTRQKFYELTHARPNFTRDVVLYNPIDVGELVNRMNDIPEKYVRLKREEYGILEGDIVIGRLGRADIVKWSDTLIYALPLIIRRVPRVKIILQSVPRSRSWLLRHSPWKNSLILIDQQDPKYDVALFFKLVDLYVHASKIGESFGNALAEASACSKAIIVQSTPRADNAQIEIVDNERTGVVVSNAVEFANAVIMLSSDKHRRKKLGHSGYVKAKKKFDASIIARELDRLYSEKNNQQRNKAEYQRWRKEYTHRLEDTYRSGLTVSDRVFLRVISILSLLTRPLDFIEHIYTT